MNAIIAGWIIALVIAILHFHHEIKSHMRSIHAQLEEIEEINTDFIHDIERIDIPGRIDTLDDDASKIDEEEMRSVARDPRSEM